MPNRDQLKQLVEDTTNQACLDSKELLEQVGIKPEAYARVVLTALSTGSPKILDCTPQSLRNSILKCATLGILPDGDQASIVPYGGKAKLVVGWKGMADLAREAIPGIALVMEAVTTADEFVYEEGLKPILRHVKNPTGERCTEGNFLASYMLAWMPGNEMPERVVMFKPEIDYIRKTYSWEGSEAWIREYAEQAKKTAGRRMGKRLPIRSGLLKVGGRDIGSNAFDDPADVPPDTPEPKNVTPPKKREKKEEKKAPATVETTAKKVESAPEDEPQKGFNETSPTVEW